VNPNEPKSWRLRYEAICWWEGGKGGGGGETQVSPNVYIVMIMMDDDDKGDGRQTDTDLKYFRRQG